ncbi:MAG: hypothetical protein HY028_01755 [Gammaproteobacteria bacterium]|nr:hypothetical protein [Gammaproteobacteria bacterium]
MDIRDFVVVIILFIFADIIFYVVVMKGLMVKSIVSKTPAEERRDNPRQEGPAYTVELRHATPARLERPISLFSVGGQVSPAETVQDLGVVMRHELAYLSVQNFRFVPPHDLMVGEPARLELQLTQNIVEPITRAINHASPAKLTTLKIGAHLIAGLRGDGFRITPVAHEEQGLGVQSTLQWAWNVLPLKSGDRSLDLDLTLRLKIPSGEETRVYSWPECKVRVEPNAYFVAKTFIKGRWKALFAVTALLAAGFYVWLRG